MNWLAYTWEFRLTNAYQIDVLSFVKFFSIKFVADKKKKFPIKFCYIFFLLGQKKI